MGLFLDVFETLKQLLRLLILSSAQKLEKVNFRLGHSTNIRVDLPDLFDNLLEPLVVLDICARMDHIFLMGKNCAPLDLPFFVEEVLKIFVLNRLYHLILVYLFLVFCFDP